MNLPISNVLFKSHLVEANALGLKLETRRVRTTQKCRLGGAGGLLRVRERIRGFGHWYIGDDDQTHWAWDLKIPLFPGQANYTGHEDGDRGYCLWRPLPSIHMPNWACRQYLMKESVEVEALQDITHEGAVREGMADTPKAVADFADLWDQINASRGYSWKSNPWVWVVKYHLHEQIDFKLKYKIQTELAEGGTT